MWPGQGLGGREAAPGPHSLLSPSFVHHRRYVSGPHVTSMKRLNLNSSAVTLESWSVQEMTSPWFLGPGVGIVCVGVGSRWGGGCEGIESL